MLNHFRISFQLSTRKLLKMSPYASRSQRNLHTNHNLAFRLIQQTISHLNLFVCFREISCEKYHRQMFDLNIYTISANNNLTSTHRLPPSAIWYMAKCSPHRHIWCAVLGIYFFLLINLSLRAAIISETSPLAPRTPRNGRGCEFM